MLLCVCFAEEKTVQPNSYLAGSLSIASSRTVDRFQPIRDILRQDANDRLNPSGKADIQSGGAKDHFGSIVSVQ